jgi:hypothetical protein
MYTLVYREDLRSCRSESPSSLSFYRRVGLDKICVGRPSALVVWYNSIPSTGSPPPVQGWEGKALFPTKQK